MKVQGVRATGARGQKQVGAPGVGDTKGVGLNADGRFVPRHKGWWKHEANNGSLAKEPSL